MEGIPSIPQLIREVNAATPNHLASCALEKLSTDLMASSASLVASADRARVQKLLQIFFPSSAAGEGGLTCTCPAASKKCPILFFRAFFVSRGPEAMLKKLQENLTELPNRQDTEMEQWMLMIVHQSLVLMNSAVCDTCITPLAKAGLVATEARSIINMMNRSLLHVPYVPGSFVVVSANLVLGEVSLPIPAIVAKIDEYNSELRKTFNPKALIAAKHSYLDFTVPAEERRKSQISRFSRTRASTSVNLDIANAMNAGELQTIRQKTGFDFAVALSKSSTLGHRFQAMTLLEALAGQNYRKAECLLHAGLVNFSCDRVGLARISLQQGLAIPWDDQEGASLRQMAKDVLKWTEQLDPQALDLSQLDRHSWITFAEFFPLSLNVLQTGPVKAAAAVLEHFLKVLNKEQLNNTRVLANPGWQSPLFVLMRFPALRDQIPGFEDEKSKPGMKVVQEKVSTLAAHIFSRLAFTYFTLYEGKKKTEKKGKDKKKGEGKEEETIVSGSSFVANKSIIEFLLESFDVMENTIGFTEVTTKLMREMLIGIFKLLTTFTNAMKIDSFTGPVWNSLFDLLQVAENFVFYSGVNESVSLNSIVKGGSLTRYVVPARESPRPFKERHFASVGIHFGPKGQCLDSELVGLITSVLSSFDFREMAPTSDMNSEEAAACKRVKTRGTAELFFFESAADYLQNLTNSNSSGLLADKNPVFVALMEARHNERLSSGYLDFLKADEIPPSGLKGLLSKKQQKGAQMKKFKSSFVSVQNAQLYFKAKRLLADDPTEKSKLAAVAKKQATSPSAASFAVTPKGGGPKPAKFSYFSDKAKEDAQSKEQQAAMLKGQREQQMEQTQRIADEFIREIMNEPAPDPHKIAQEKARAAAEAKAAEAKKAEEQKGNSVVAATATRRSVSRIRVTHIALEAYEAEEDIEMSIRADDRLCVTQEKDGWSQATNFESGEVGWIPTDFIEAVPEDFDVMPPEPMAPPPDDSFEDIAPPPEEKSDPQALVKAQEEERQRILAASRMREVAKCVVCKKGLNMDEIYERPSEVGKAYCEADFRKTFFSCGTCKEVVGEEEPSINIPNKTEPADEDDDDVTFYHMKCLQCSVCKMKTDSVELMMGFEGELFCQNDYALKRGAPCAWCNGMIKGEPLEALGQTWHQDHFMCFGKCGKNLSSEKFYVPNESQMKYHQAKLEGVQASDAARLLLLGSIKIDAHDGGASAMNELGKLTVEKVAAQVQEQPFCQLCFTERFKRVCGSCKLEIMEWETGVTVGDSHVPFHSRCFNCSVCEREAKVLSTAPSEAKAADKKLLLGEDNTLFCEPHFYAKFMTKANCTVCRKPLKDPLNPSRACINVQDFEYHVDCLRCKTCQVNLSTPGQQTFIHSLLPLVKEAEFYCETHYETVIMEANAPTCRHCGKKVVQGGFAIKGNYYHADCKKCKKCNIPLNVGSPGPDKLVFILKKLDNGEPVGDMYCPKDKP